MGIKIKPLSLYLENGFTTEEFFTAIGNKDGAASRCLDDYYIIYNDRQPHHRVRFTLAEELMHIVLGHADDFRFKFGTPYHDEVYQQYEAEAKLGASLILMPPQLYYQYRGYYKFRKLAAMFDVSDAAAVRAFNLYDREEQTFRQIFTSDLPRYYPKLSPDFDYKPISVSF